MKRNASLTLSQFVNAKISVRFAKIPGNYSPAPPDLIVHGVGILSEDKREASEELETRALHASFARNPRKAAPVEG